MRYFVFVCMFVMPFMFSGCSSKKLTRNFAAEKISAAVDSTIVKVKFNSGFVTILPGANSDVMQKIVNLANGGFVTYHDIGTFTYEITISPSMDPFILTSLSPQNNHYIDVIGGLKGKSFIEHDVLLFKRKFVGVTGIKINDTAGSSKSDAQVEFSYKSETTPIASSFGMQDNGTQQGVASFSLYDDGWRLTSIDVGNVGPLEKIDNTKITLSIKSKKSGDAVKLAFTVGKSETLKNGNKLKLLEYTKQVDKFMPGFKGSAVRIELITKDNTSNTFIVLEKYPEVNAQRNDDEIIQLVKIEDNL